MSDRTGALRSTTTCPLVFHTAARGELSTVLPMSAWTTVDFETAEVLAATASTVNDGPAPVPTGHAGDSDPNPDEALRRVQGRPARANIDTLIARIGQWHQEQVDAAYAERDEQLDASVAYELTLAGWSA